MSKSTPIFFKSVSINENPIEILDGMKAIESEKTKDSITYDFYLLFDGNENQIKIHIAVNLVVVSIIFDPEDKEQFNWAKNGGNNKFGMNIYKSEYYDDELKLNMFVTHIDNERLPGFFSKKVPSTLIVKQTKQIKDKNVESIIFKENLLDKFYSVSIPVKESIISMVFNKKRLNIVADKINSKFEIREIPFISTAFLYIINE